MESILREIRNSIGKEHRSAPELYTQIGKTIGKALFDRKIDKDQVVEICSCLIVMYTKLKEGS